MRKAYSNIRNVIATLKSTQRLTWRVLETKWMKRVSDLPDILNDGNLRRLPLLDENFY